MEIAFLVGFKGLPGPHDEVEDAFSTRKINQAQEREKKDGEN